MERYRVKGVLNNRTQIRRFERADEAKAFANELGDAGAEMIRVSVDDIEVNDLSELDTHIAEEGDGSVAP